MNAAPGRPRLGLLPPLLRSWVRHAQVASTKAAAATTPTKDAAPKTTYTIPEGHGEKVWVFAHRRSDQVILSLKETLDAFHAMKQLPFNGKKTKPAKIRKDYWSPMAVIEFPAGMGSVGRSVFQKLRELKHLHEVSWPDELRHKPESDFTKDDRRKIAESEAEGRTYHPIRSKKERGIAINAQRKNVIADMAVVLGGQGGGNKMAAHNRSKAYAARWGHGGVLVPVTVKWSNDQDMHFAESWTANVTHAIMDKPAYTANPEPVDQAASPPQETVAGA